MNLTQKKLHILFLCGWYPSRVLPNNGDFIQRHAEAVSLLHKVSVIHIISDVNCKAPIEFSSEKINGVQTYIAYVKTSRNSLKKGILFYKCFQQLLKKVGDFEIVHVNKLYPFGLFALYLKWFQKKQFIITEHWTGYFYPQSKNISNIQLFLSKLIAKHAKFITPVSNELKQAMLGLNFQGNYCIIPNVINTELFIPKKQTSKTFTILHISNMLDIHKNVSGIIRAVKLLSEVDTNFELILIGEKSIQYKKLSDELQISDQIKFIEHIPHEDVVSFLQNADVYVSFSNYETWGIVMIEAIACGIPVISTDTGIINELQEKNFYKIIPKKDENALMNSILEFKNMSINNINMHTFVKENFSTKIVAKKFSSIYFDAIHK